MGDDDTYPSDPSNTGGDGGYFADADELTAEVVDRRITDSVRRSSFADAQAVVAAFAVNTGAGAWAPSLTRPAVAAGLEALATVTESTFVTARSKSGPGSIQQGVLNLCGPAAFFEMALNRDPLAVIQFATTLFEIGSAYLGSLHVAPREDLLGADFAALSAKGEFSFSPAVWMLLGALRNWADVFWQGSWTGDPNQAMSGMTRPEELANWMRASGIWSGVQDNGKWASNPGFVQASELPSEDGVDVALLINTNLIAESTLWDPTSGQPEPEIPVFNPLKPDNTFLLKSFPNHWVILLGEVMSDADGENVLLPIWTWGSRYYLCVPTKVFIDNYYGSVVGRCVTLRT